VRIQLVYVFERLDTGRLVGFMREGERLSGGLWVHDPERGCLNARQVSGDVPKIMLHNIHYIDLG
jgi:hypothetical protein